MAIKQVEDLVEAWARGHRIICSACKCSNVQAALELIPDEFFAPLGRRGRLAIRHFPGSTTWLIWHDGERWLPNIDIHEDKELAGLCLEQFLEDITIIK